MAFVIPAASDAVPTILFGAFDRHNFGDLLFPHIALALLSPAHPVLAGVAARDLRTFGGHRVEALADLAARLRDQPVNILHVGGELLACDIWQAAVMTLPPEEALDTILRFDERPRDAREWARQRTGIAALAPYTVNRALFPRAKCVVFNAVGGVDLDGWDQAFRDEVLEKLRNADAVGVRDTVTQALLHAAGVRTLLMPDPAVLMEQVFGEGIRRRSGEGETARMRKAFPQGYVAVQFSADFGDDATLSEMADRLDALADDTGLGIVFFRAGAAPWHDDIACFERTVARMRRGARIFTSLDLWDICALIAASRCYLGGSLHGRIVAMAFGLPRVSLLRMNQRGERSKQGAYASTWDDGMPGAIGMPGIVDGVQAALAADPLLLEQKAADLADRYCRAFRALTESFA
ncbi:polysaccharide pyruvyl transferase family protein [Noviherbaspirillum sp. ST9]|uniref:polysaccharide pyruvyl transferase family protein n=1 Tax=Noviherbaspirillum sp. ST9 TaxID=3401606 RepID=UPI003B5863B3